MKMKMSSRTSFVFSSNSSKWRLKNQAFGFLIILTFAATCCSGLNKITPASTNSNDRKHIESLSNIQNEDVATKPLFSTDDFHYDDNDDDQITNAFNTKEATTSTNTKTTRMRTRRNGRNRGRFSSPRNSRSKRELVQR